jgi:hypothetical protein
MATILMPLASLSIYWHLPFLIVIISLVYSATRYEEWPSIARETARWVARMSAFLLTIGAALWVLSVCV